MYINNYRRTFFQKNIVITGFNSGIGKKTCSELLNLGANLILLGRKNISFKKNKKVFFFKTDLENFMELEGNLKLIKKKFPKIEGFVHSAAQNQTKTIDKISTKEWMRIVNINLTSSFIICRDLLENFKKSKNSSIVLISSIAGHRKSPVSGVHYVSSKSGIIGLVKQLSHEFGKYNIRINCLCPSQTLTPMLLKSMNKSKLNILKKNIPLSRLAKTEEQSNVIVFLLSKLSSYINGATINVDGGQI